MITIKIDDQPLQQRLKHIEEALGPSHLYKVLDTIGQDLVEGTRTRIAAGHDWQDRPFAANRDVTLSRKRGSKPLIDIGNFLAHGFSHHVSASSVTIGASAAQAAVLQFGARKGQFGRR
jgi:phage gpG-like protein